MDDETGRARLTSTFNDLMTEHPVDVVLDYLWGPSAECLIAAVASRHSKNGEAQPRLRFVQIGNLSGATVSLPGGALRSSGLELLGSGLGSVANARLVAIVGELMQAAVTGHFKIGTQAVPLAAVESAWAAQGAGRTVFILPGSGF